MNETQVYPLVTFALFAYNQEKFIRDAVEGALGQKYAKLEIIFSDDCSNDNTFEIINTLVSNYTGPHEIIVNRNSVNLGLAKHFSKIVATARGEIVVVGAGDDISLPTRVSKTVEMLSSDPKAAFASFTDTVIDEDGAVCSKPRTKSKGTLTKVTLEDYIEGYAPPLSGASRGYKKKVFELFGDIDEHCPTEDTPSVLRGLMMGYALVSSECGIYYRQHSTNLSGPASLHSMKFEEIKKQYLRDADFAQATGVIEKVDGEKIIKWAERNYRHRLLTKEYYFSSNKIKFYCQNIILSKDYKFREKLGLIRRLIQS